MLFKRFLFSQVSIFTLGGSDFKKAEDWFLERPAEAKLMVGGSAMVVRFQRSAERPPFIKIRLDMPLMPLAGLPYLQMRKLVNFFHYFRITILPSNAKKFRLQSAFGLSSRKAMIGFYGFCAVIS